jgi:Uma2 family endonuclease
MRPETLREANSPAARRMTAEELWRLPDDGMRRELVRGELLTMPPSGGEHGLVGGNVLGPLWHHVKSRHLGAVFNAEIGFVIARNPDTVRAPDVAFVRQDRIPTGGIPQEYWPGAPDLAVVGMSPSDSVKQVEEKARDWLSAGTRMVWVVNPRRRRVTVFRPDRSPIVLTEKDPLDGADVVEGFQIRVAELFA